MHAGLFFIGDLGSDELLTGVRRNFEPKGHFYLITIGALFVISALASITIATKKSEACWKDRQSVHNINIMINNGQGQPQQNLNTKKHNDPILNTVLLVVHAIVFIGVFVFFFEVFNVNEMQ